MAERSFAAEVEKLRVGAGVEFRGEGILAVTKALLQSGVSYVGGYQGAPISHLLDVFADANDLLRELGVYFEACANEASACAMLAASVNYPLRGAVAWKSVVGTNVASDALSNLASGGVTGGALIILGEDYGEGSSIIQERSHAFAMKSQVWLLDPRPSLPLMVDMVEKGFQLSEASNTPVMLELRMRACHLYGRFIAKDNQAPTFTRADALAAPSRDVNRISLPPATYMQERQKLEQRRPAAVDFIRRHGLNERFGPETGKVGVIVQGGLFNTAMHALALEGLADAFGGSALPIYCMNVAYPLVDEELIDFCQGKDAVLLIEEGYPEYLEFEINSLLRKLGLPALLVGKDVLPRAGEYTADVVRAGLVKFLAAHFPEALPAQPIPDAAATEELADVAASLPARPPGFCTGCPERPVFTAIKLVERETGPLHVSSDIGCHLFSVLPPFNLGNTTMGYGLAQPGGAAFGEAGDKRAIAIMGDGGFWHNGLASGAANAVFNKNDNVLLVIDNNYAAATGGQDVMSTRADNKDRSTRHAISAAVKGVGIDWVRQVDHTYDLKTMTATLREALTTQTRGPKVVVAQTECMLNKQRREKPLFAKAVKSGERRVRERFGVDEDTCTGDHSCIRLSGCPSLSIKPNPDPLRQDPVAHVENSCVGCGLCGEVSHAAVLCPSFYRADIVYNPKPLERTLARLGEGVIGWLQKRAETARAARAA